MSIESGFTAATPVVRRTISPYDLTAGDNPGILISKPLLRGANYDEWASNIRLALKARKKFGFADGTILQPLETSPDHEDWIANNSLIVSWIKLTIEEQLCSSLSFTDDAHELWTHIQKRYGVKNGQRVQRIKTELANCRQRGHSIETYYNNLNKLWRNLSDYQQAKTMEEVRKEREEDKLHQFLLGLDDTIYGTVKSSLLSREPLPSLEEAYNVVARDEDSKTLARSSTEGHDAVSFAVQTHHRSVSDSKNSMVVCSLCGKSGHLTENCFKHIGYPPWWEDRRRNRSANTQNSVSSAVNSNTSAPSQGSSVIKGKAVATTTRVHHVSAQQSTPESMGISGLNNDQWQTLINMLAEQKSSSSNRLSGSHHEDPDWGG